MYKKPEEDKFYRVKKKDIIFIFVNCRLYKYKINK